MKIEFEVSESFRETNKSIPFSVSMNLWAPRTFFLMSDSHSQPHSRVLARLHGVFIVFVYPGIVPQLESPVCALCSLPAKPPGELLFLVGKHSFLK